MNTDEETVNLTRLPTVPIVGMSGCMDFKFVRMRCPYADNPENRAVKLRFVPTGCNTIDRAELGLRGITGAQIREVLDDPELQETVVVSVLPELAGKTYAWSITETSDGDFVIEAGYTRQPYIQPQFLQAA